MSEAFGIFRKVSQLRDSYITKIPKDENPVCHNQDIIEKHVFLNFKMYFC